MPRQPHSELWDDENEPSMVGWKRIGLVSPVGFAALAVLVAKNAQVPLLSVSKALLSVM